ncbi:DMT family transporter [Roseivivax sediminis]|uniref:EamA-like transporter family protein n=1 Tax=Roseivivax sediminis TaxID=936889 RepID=A0A1I1WCS1_9RHOB|nr:DMT family transporter [Roseivivax sediminis]SFD92947.1 EamA-like transporter family protein [Roseivivax sediminis]
MSSLGFGLIAAFCWGLHDIAIRYLSRTVPLLGALFVVLIAGAVFQGGALVLRAGDLALGPEALVLSALSGATFLVASIGLYFAFERGPVRLVSPIIGAYPLLSLVFEAMQGRPVGSGQIVAVLCVIAGVAVVAMLSDRSDGTDPPRGPTILLALMSGAGFASTFKLGQMAAEIDGELPTTLAARTIAVTLLAAFLLWRRAPVWPGRRALLPLMAMGALDGVALLSVISAATLAHPQLAAVAASMFGLFTIVLAWGLLSERMTAGQWAGCLVAFLGIGYLAL